MAKETFSSLIDLFKTSSSSSSSSSVALECSLCGNKLGVFRKKKPCVECRRLFCTQCVGRCRDRALRCRNCSILTMRPPIRAELLTLRVKELQFYLSQHNVSTHGCVEKDDLVNVVLRYASAPSYASGAQHYAASTFAESTSGSGLQSTSNQQTAGPQSTSTFPTSVSDSSSTSSFEMVQEPDLRSSQDNIESLESISAISSEEAGARTGITFPAVRLETDLIESESQAGTDHSSETAVQDRSVLSSNLVASSQPTLQPSSTQPAVENASPSYTRGTIALMECEADLETLTVKQLKDMLIRHGVNYRGCCEKGELVDRAKVLYRDYHASRAELDKLDLNELCKICMDAPVECVMLECGHMATCTQCGRQLNECPICRQYVVRIVRTFKA